MSTSVLLYSRPTFIQLGDSTSTLMKWHPGWESCLLLTVWDRRRERERRIIRCLRIHIAGFHTKNEAANGYYHQFQGKERCGSMITETYRISTSSCWTCVPKQMTFLNTNTTVNTTNNTPYCIHLRPQPIFVHIYTREMLHRPGASLSKQPIKVGDHKLTMQQTCQSSYCGYRRREQSFTHRELS